MSLRTLHTSSFAKIVGISHHDSIGFDEKMLYLTDKAGQITKLPIESIIDFYTTKGIIWDDFTIAYSGNKKYVIDGIPSSQSDNFIDAFDKEYAKSYYEYYTSLITPLLKSIPDNNQYWKHNEFNTLAAKAAKLFTNFQYRKVPPTQEQRKRFEMALRLKAADISLQTFHNEQFKEQELKFYKQYFDTIEKKPLTQKQREAVVINERSNLIIAGAGSGKTSVMVAKAGYVIQKYEAKPQEILLLAFNKSAAQELQERISERLKLDSIRSSTFHALGLDVIAKATGRKPSLAKSAEDDRELEKFLLSIIGQLSNTSKTFSNDMALFLAFPFAKYRSKDSFASQREYDQYLETNNIGTLKGDKVKSYEEAQIANFLFINQVQYEYEPYYCFDTATQDHRQYQPDFYLPQHDIYIEHFGVDEEGKTAPYIDNKTYLEGMEWKRELHKHYKTRLLETYSYEKRKGGLTENLAKKLKRQGVVFSPLSAMELLSNFDNEKSSNPVIKLFGTFLNNFKSNRLHISELKQRVSEDERILAFLKIFEPLKNAYEKDLKSRGEIDFNDMIIQASDFINSGAYTSPYRFILVDEFQDISVARSNLVKALLGQHPDNVLTAVGDDWQSINRFAGSDISIFRDFEDYFGKSDQVMLDYTFRYNDKIAQVSQRFIENNPSQIKKNIKTLSSLDKAAVHVWWNQDKDILNVFNSIIERLIQQKRDKPFSVFVLARYWFLLPKPSELSAIKKKFPNIEFIPSSTHGSKGLEADFVIGLGIESGRYGFPSTIEDDPLIDIVLAKQEDFEHAEERRLFYVLLTRAKEEVYLVASLNSRSFFSIELEDPGYIIEHIYPNGSKPRLCPICQNGMMVMG